MNLRTLFSLVATLLVLGMTLGAAGAQARTHDRRIPVAQRYTAHAPKAARHARRPHGAAKKVRRVYAPEEGRGGRRSGAGARHGPARPGRTRPRAAAFASSPTAKAP